MATVEAGCRKEARKKKGREEEEEENSRERQVRNEIAPEVAAGIKKKASAHEDAKPTAQKTVGESVKQNWDCSHVEYEEEERKGRTGKRRTRWKDNGPKMRGGEDSGTKKSGRTSQ